MKNLFPLLIGCLFLNFSYGQLTSLPPNFEDVEIDSCRYNAAYKLVDQYIFRSGQNMEITDIDIIACGVEGFSRENSGLVSIQWIGKSNGSLEIFWISGVLTMDDTCCSTRFRLTDHSRSINSAYIESDLVCTRRFVQKSIGVGRPFKSLGTGNPFDDPKKSKKQ